MYSSFSYISKIYSNPSISMKNYLIFTRRDFSNYRYKFLKSVFKEKNP